MTMKTKLSPLMNRITVGDCRHVIPRIPDSSIDAVVTDPPYGENMGYDGDDNRTTSRELLKDFLSSVMPKLKRGAHVCLFWTMKGVDVPIEEVKSAGLTFRRVLSMYIPKGGARPYLGWLPRTQAIVIAQNYLPNPPGGFHTTMCEYLYKAMTDSGHTRTSLARHLGCDSRLIMKWTRVGDPAWCLPTPRFYKPLKALLCLDETFDILLNREPSRGETRSDFKYQHDTYVVRDTRETFYHPSQKPLSVVEHVVSCAAPTGGVVLDGFSGCGTTAEACVNTGRNFIAIEIDKMFAQISNNRIGRSE